MKFKTRIPITAFAAIVASFPLVAQDARERQPLRYYDFSPETQAGGTSAAAAGVNDKKTLAALDTEYQAAVKINDVATMDRLLADDFTLVVGSGKTFSKADLLEESRSGRYHYDHQEDTEQTVRIWGDTAVVTAKLWMQGTESGKPFDRTVWFSDTYVRTSSGWRYVFGQSSLALPNTSH